MSSAGDGASVGDAAAPPHEFPISNPPGDFESFRYQSRFGFHYTEQSYNNQWNARATKREKYQQREAFPRPDGLEHDEWKKAFNSADSVVYKEQGGSSVASGRIRRETYQTREIAEERLYNKYLAAGKPIPGPDSQSPYLPRLGPFPSGNNSNFKPAQQRSSSSRKNKPKKTSTQQQQPPTFSSSRSSSRKRKSTHKFQAPSGSNLHQPNPFSRPKNTRKKAVKKSSSANKPQIGEEPFEFTAGEDDPPLKSPPPKRPFVNRPAPPWGFRPNQNDHDTVYNNLYIDERPEPFIKKTSSKLAQPAPSPPTQESQSSRSICKNSNPYRSNRYVTSSDPSDRVLVSANDQLAFDPRIAAEQSSTAKKRANEQASSENEPRKRQKKRSTKVRFSCNADKQDRFFHDDPEDDPDHDHDHGPSSYPNNWNNYDNSTHEQPLSYQDNSKSGAKQSSSSYQKKHSNSYEQSSPPENSEIGDLEESLADFYLGKHPRKPAKTRTKLPNPPSYYGSGNFQTPTFKAPQGSSFDHPHLFASAENLKPSEKPFDYSKVDPQLLQLQFCGEIAARALSSLDNPSAVEKQPSSSGKSGLGATQPSGNPSLGAKKSSGNSKLGPNQPFSGKLKLVVKQSSGDSKLGTNQPSSGNSKLGTKQSSSNSKLTANQPSSSNSKLTAKQSTSNKSSFGTQKPHLSNNTKAKMSSQAKKQKTKADYCSCKQVRHGTKMIACEGGCENWYHVSCVKLLCKDTDGVAKFICDDCVGHAGPTTYKRVCRLRGCSRPHSTTEGVDEGGNAVTIHSKYCSVEHRDKYWADAVARVDKDLLPELRSFLAQTAPGGFKTAGDQPTRAGLGVGGGGSAAGGGIVATGPPQSEEGMFSFDIKLRDSCHKNIAGFSATIVHYQNREKLVAMVERYSAETTKKYAEENGIEESAPKRAKGKAGKVVAHTICGYDPRLQASDRRIDRCLATPEGDEAWKSGVLGERPDFYVEVDPEFYKGICVKTNCPRHAGWLKIHQQECTVNLALNADWMEKEKVKLAEMYERVRVRVAIEREREQYAQDRAAEMPEESRVEFLRLWKVTKGDKNIILRKLLARFEPQGTAA